MVFVVDSDEVFGKCLLRVLKKNNFKGYLFGNAISAIDFISQEIPKIIFIDVMLTGPDGFTFLNEMASYADTMNIPVVVVSEKDFSPFDLSEYNVVGFLDKSKMKPEEIVDYVRKFA